MFKRRDIYGELFNPLNNKDIMPQPELTIPEPRYSKPKILLIDIKDNSETVLRAAGYKIDVGTFGTPYKVKQDEGYLRVITDANLPNYAEQEIIVVDLSPKETSEQSRYEEVIREENYFFGNCSQGVIDPRPAVMSTCKPSFDRILKHNGVFVIFADAHIPYRTVFASESRKFGFRIISSDFNNWSFLTLLEQSNFSTNQIEGDEIFVVSQDTPLLRLLSRYVHKSHITCTLHPTKLQNYNREIIGYSNRSKESWIEIATNKYNAPVAGIFTPDEKNNGWVFIFPQIENKSDFLLEFLCDVLPELTPELFPYSEKLQWIYRDEYQPNSVLELNREKLQIEEETKYRIAEIQEQIKREQEKFEYQNHLLTETDDELVKAVKKSLEVLGFISVIDVDDELAKKGKNNNKDEDLQILDEPTTVLVEVKGITGFPTDDDTLQILKHVPNRMREWNRVNVKGLTIINHQRAIPALQRQQHPIFREALLTSAKDQHLGLMTTFDLYRLVRSFLKNGWKHEDVKSLFEQSGRIEPIPSHYEYVGKVEEIWGKAGAFSVNIEENSLKLKNRIAFDLPLEFEEQVIESLQLDGSPVEVAKTQTIAGIKTNSTIQFLKKGIRVFRILD